MRQVEIYTCHFHLRFQVFERDKFGGFGVGYMRSVVRETDILNKPNFDA